MTKQASTEAAWIESIQPSTAPKRKRKPKPSDAGPCVRALQQAAAVKRRLSNGEISQSEYERQVNAIVEGVQ